MELDEVNLPSVAVTAGFLTALIVRELLHASGRPWRHLINLLVGLGIVFLIIAALRLSGEAATPAVPSAQVTSESQALS